MIQFCYTIFGEKYDFSSIKSYADFRKSVPVKTYEEFFPYIQKLRKGEENILWPGGEIKEIIISTNQMKIL